jgi:hypothetical protein
MHQIRTSLHVASWLLLALVLVMAAPISARTTRSSAAPADESTVWQIPKSSNLVPHFEEANGKPVLYVDGQPFTALAVEIPWWDLIYPRYKATETAYDNLYPAAEKLGLNTLKVPIKWSMIEPEQGMYDFSYLDHARDMAQKYHLKLVLNWFGHYASGDGTIYRNLTGDLFAPMYIVNDETTYPRAVDSDGKVHHNTLSYNYQPIISRETAAFRAFMQHIKQVDSQTHTIIMIQVENEIAVFGADRRNPKLWRDHSPAADKLFREKGFSDDLKFSAWNMAYNWIRPLTDAGAEVYPLPFFHNYVGGKIADWMVGGAPGEDVSTALQNCPHLSFVGVNSYFCGQWRPDNSCARPPEGSIAELREPLLRYSVDRNRPAITETNSGNSFIAARLVYLAVGEFRVPIFAPWALTVSYPENYQPYVLPDGTLANGAPYLHDAYTSLNQALPQILYYAATPKLKVFMARLPGQPFSETKDVNGFQVTASGADDGQIIVIHPSAREFLLVGFRSSVSFRGAFFQWPAMKSVRVQRVTWSDHGWLQHGEPAYGIDQSAQILNIELDTPQAVLVSW